jgi:tetratricopeptide (TPR) repeat protein
MSRLNMATTRCVRASLLLACWACPSHGSCSQPRNAEPTGAHVIVGSAQAQEIGAPPSRPSDASDAAPIDDVQLQKAASLAKARDYTDADSTVRTYLAKHADSADGHFLLGYVLYRQNQPTKSLAEYTEGARYRNPSAADLAAVAMDYVLLGADADADKWLTRATAMEPSNGLYWYYLGRTKYEENRFEQAVDAFQKCLVLMPHNVRAEYNLGLAYAGKSLDDKAIEAYETAIAWQRGTPHEDPQPYLDLGMLLASEGHLQESVPDLEKAVTLDAQNPKIHEQMGRVYEQLHELTKAQKELESAIALAPKVSSLHFQLGRIYQKEGMADRAKVEFARCAVLNGTHSTDSSETPNADVHSPTTVSSPQ